MQAISVSSFIFLGLLSISCPRQPKDNYTHTASSAISAHDTLKLPAPDESASRTIFARVIGWKEGEKPVAPRNFKVSAFIKGIKSPRNTYVLPNGDVLAVLSNSERSEKEQRQNKVSGKAASEVPGKSANTILLLRDKNQDGMAEETYTFLAGLNQPYGLTLIGNSLYVAHTDGVYKYPYKTGDTTIKGKGIKIVKLPAGGYNNHWTRNLLSAGDGRNIFISVGSGSNVGENGMHNEICCAAILRVDTSGKNETVYADGLRNPVGLALHPETKKLYTVVNERDGLGDDLVPDYFTSVKEGAFYGWPYSYFGQHEDPRLKGQRPDLVKKAIVPDYPLGAHTASLGLTFYDGEAFPQKYHNGAFIGQHGSWNRSEFVGYKVIFIPYTDGKWKPAEDFLTGFIAGRSNEVHGRPVGVTLTKDGSLLVCDDAAGVIWHIGYTHTN